MERMRFKNGFDYSITTNNTIDAGAIFIPPLLLQPFCENAIWHGLMHKDGQGHLNISITEENRFLNCAITDDGVGREKAATYKSKSAEREKSLGLKITSARLALLNKEQNKETAYQIEDVLNEEGDIAGTKVNLKIFYKEFLEEIEQHA
jgi:sensor histidine kinase YesM